MFTLLVWLYRRRKKGVKRSFLAKIIDAKSASYIYGASLLIDLVLIILISIGINIMVMNGTLSRLNSAIAGYVSSQDEDGRDKPEETPYSWDFTNPSPSPQPGGGGGNSSGGIQFVDKKIQFRYDLIELIKRSIDLTQSPEMQSDGYVETRWKISHACMLGTVCRETSGSIFTYFDSSGLDSLYDGLIPTAQNHLCNKYPCSYIRNGVSHFVGGTVSGDVDNGDPYTQIVDYSHEKYKTIGKGNHGCGYFQMETYLSYTTHFRYVYPNTSPVWTTSEISPYASSFTPYSTVEAKIVKDQTLGFLRPNFYYLPDAVYNSTIANSRAVRHNKVSDSIVQRINKLSEENQAVVMFIYEAEMYWYGLLTDHMDWSLLEQVIALAESGKSLPNLLKSDDISKYFDSNKMTPINNLSAAKEYLEKTYGLSAKNGKGSYYGLAFACIGQIYIDEMQKIFDSAEKVSTPNGGGGGNGGNGAVAGDLGSVEYTLGLMNREYQFDLSQKPGGLKYRQWFYKSTSPAYYYWCANFVTYIWHHAGILDFRGADKLGRNNFLSCSQYIEWAEDYAGQTGFSYHPKSEVFSGTYTPKPGDAILYTGHIGLVESVSGTGRGTKVTTIEGNTSSKDSRPDTANGAWRGVVDRNKNVSLTPGRVKGFITYDWSRGAKSYTIID